MVQHYRELIDDPIRIDLFRRSIAKCVQPGMTVADIGCGLGTYGIFAARAGAKRVYSVDETGILEVAREVATANSCADVLRFLPGRSTEIEVPERVDLVIFEDYVAGLITPTIVAVLRDLRTRWLKPGGLIVPHEARIWVAAVEARELHQSLDRFAGTNDRVFGIDFGPARRRAFATPQMVNLKPAMLLTDPALVTTLDFMTIETAQLSWQVNSIVKRDAVLHGVLLWFDLALLDTYLGTGPLDPPSAWRQVFLPFSTPLKVVHNETLHISGQVAPLGDAMIWRWKANGTLGEVVAHSLDATLLSREARRGARPDIVPQRTEHLELDAFILSLVNGSKNISEIAIEVQKKFAKSVDETQTHIARTLSRYAK